MTPKYELGQTVFKWTGDYTGPGVVRGHAVNNKNQVRYLVGHKVEGGKGEFLHVYAEGNLREPSADDGLPTANDVRDILADDKAELLDALATAHRQVDMLMALLITHDNSFMPTKSSLWPDIVKRVALIQKHEGAL